MDTKPYALDKTRKVNKSMMRSMHTLSPNDNTDETTQTSRPSPLDFETFLPWACQQFHSTIDVVVRNEIQRDYVPTDRSKTKAKAKIKDRLTGVTVPDLVSAITEIASAYEPPDSSKVEIHAMYNAECNLVHIKILKNKRVPRRILQILQLIIKFHPYAEAITIDRGIDKYTIYEISKLLPLSHITELCFDNTFLEQANYYILLDNPNQLKYLSLSKCNLNDAFVEKLAEKLQYPNPASTILSILNLSINRITDAGVRALGRMLRSNRQLSYLNLAGNLITDNGAEAIFNVLLEFPLTYEEMIASKTRYTSYLKRKNEIIAKLLVDLKTSAMVPDPKKKKPIKPIPASPKKSTRASISDEDNCYERAKEMARGILGDFTDSFVIDVVRTNGTLYSNGNNTLAYLNLAYNNLSECTLKKIIKVLNHQNNIMRKPKGLLNCKIEGNPFDQKADKELEMIELLIDTGLSSLDRRNSLTKRKLVKK